MCVCCQVLVICFLAEESVLELYKGECVKTGRFGNNKPLSAAAFSRGGRREGEIKIQGSAALKELNNVRGQRMGSLIENFHRQCKTGWRGDEGPENCVLFRPTMMVASGK